MRMFGKRLTSHFVCFVHIRVLMLIHTCFVHVSFQSELNNTETGCICLNEVTNWKQFVIVKCSAESATSLGQPWDCDAFENCTDCDKIYCEQCTCNYLRSGFSDCEKFSCCTRFAVISLTWHSDYGIHNHDGAIVRCNDCVSYAYDNM